MDEFAERLRRMTEGRDRAVLVGAAASAAWLLLVVLFWLLGPEGGPVSGLGRLLALAGVALPLVLIWMAVALARTLAELRAEAMLLRARLDMLRAPDNEDGGAAPPPRAAMAPPVAARRPAAAQPAASRPAEATAPEPPRRVEPEDLIAALNFPDGPDDHAAIAALKASLADPEAARTIRAAQDVVTLLAKHGVYTDDLPDAEASPVLWRRFVEGQRGPGLAELALPGAEDAVEITAGLMRGDEVFRDAAHHFMRQFDRTLSRVGTELGEDAVAVLVQTRSGRAFNLLAQVTGMFG